MWEVGDHREGAQSFGATAFESWLLTRSVMAGYLIPGTCLFIPYLIWWMQGKSIQILGQMSAGVLRTENQAQIALEK